jgi:hypothetical protein
VLKRHAGRNGFGKVLVSAMILCLVFMLMSTSMLMAGPMGDPEPVGHDDPSQQPAPTDPEGRGQDGTPSSVVFSLELA